MENKNEVNEVLVQQECNVLYQQSSSIKGFYHKHKKMSIIIILCITGLLIYGIGMGIANTINNNKMGVYLIKVQDLLLDVQKQREGYIIKMTKDKFSYTEQLTRKSMEFINSVKELQKISNVSFKQNQKLKTLIMSMCDNYLKFINESHGGIYCEYLDRVKKAISFCEDGDTIYKDVKEEMLRLAKQCNVKLDKIN